jgi:hypothetical protein
MLFPDHTDWTVLTQLHNNVLHKVDVSILLKWCAVLTCFCQAYLGKGQVRPVFDTDTEHKNVGCTFHAQNLDRNQCHVT